MTISTATVLPEYYEIEFVKGKTARFKWQIWEDKAKTKPFKFVGLNVTLKIGAYLTLTEASGLTIAEGSISGILTPSQTEKMPKEREHFEVDVEETGNPLEKVCPIDGVFIARTA